MHAEPYTLVQQEAVEGDHAPSLETVGIGGYEGNTKRMKKLLWASLAEQHCWRRSLQGSKATHRLGLVVAVFLRRGRMLLEKLALLRPKGLKRRREAGGDGGPATSKPKPGEGPLKPAGLEFHREDTVVWGKVPGYPWWPAEVCELHSGGIRAYGKGPRMLRFFATEEFSYIPESHTLPFELEHVEKLVPHPHDRHYATLLKAIALANERAAVFPSGEYRTGEFVWAKLEGFPWWPAEIARTSPVTPNRPGQRLVCFFEIKEASWLNENDLKPFDPEDKEALACGRHDTVLIRAIEVMQASYAEKKEAGTLKPYLPSPSPTGLCDDAELEIKIGELNDEEEF